MGSKCIGAITVPAKNGKGDVIPLHVGTAELKKIHQAFLM